MVEVCTNVSCALYGAQSVLEAFEHELGCRAGETTADGAATLRTIECLGGCGWGTIVAVDGRYRRKVQPGDVPGDRRGAASVSARPKIVLAGTDERDLTKLAEYRGRRRLRRAREGARAWRRPP